MELDEIRDARAKAIERMNAALNEVKPVGTALWLITLIMAPIFLGLILLLILSMVWMMVRQLAYLLMRIAALPFIVLWTLVDMVVLSRWFMWLICLKVSGR